MSEERSESSHKPSWLERLSLALMGEPKDRDELMELLRDAQQRELLDPEALKMMEGVMRVSETQVRDVMLPRAQMVVLEHNWTLERLITEIVESGHSRFPVIDESKDNVIGILIEERLAVGHVQLSIVSPRLGAAISERLRQEGFAITEIPARGKDGMVTLLSCSVLRKKADHVRQIVNEVDESAFITAEDVRPVRRGFWRA